MEFQKAKNDKALRVKMYFKKSHDTAAAETVGSYLEGIKKIRRDLVDSWDFLKLLEGVAWFDLDLSKITVETMKETERSKAGSSWKVAKAERKVNKEYEACKRNRKDMSDLRLQSLMDMEKQKLIPTLSV